MLIFINSPHQRFAGEALPHIPGPTDHSSSPKKVAQFLQRAGFYLWLSTIPITAQSSRERERGEINRETEKRGGWNGRVVLTET